MTFQPNVLFTLPAQLHVSVLMVRQTHWCIYSALLVILWVSPIIQLIVLYSNSPVSYHPFFLHTHVGTPSNLSSSPHAQFFGTPPILPLHQSLDHHPSAVSAFALFPACCSLSRPPPLLEFSFGVTINKSEHSLAFIGVSSPDLSSFPPLFFQFSILPKIVNVSFLEYLLLFPLAYHVLFSAWNVSPPLSHPPTQLYPESIWMLPCKPSHQS